jgi:hypothetical protein
MKLTHEQRIAIEQAGLVRGRSNPTWAQLEDGYVYATLVLEDSIIMYIFAPSGNSYKEQHGLDNYGWTITGWDKED